MRCVSTPSGRPRTVLIGVSIIMGIAGFAWYLLPQSTVDVPVDTVVLVDADPYDVAALEGFLRRPARFFSDSHAREYVELFVAHVLLERERDRLSRIEGRAHSIDDVVARLLDGSDADVAISDEDVVAYYEAHHDRYVHSASSHVAIFQIDGAPDAERRAGALYQLAQMNASQSAFSELLASPGPGVRSETRGVHCEDEPAVNVPSPVAAVVCALRVGELSRPMEHEGVWFVARKLAEDRQRSDALATVRPQIRELLESEARTRALEHELRRLRSAANVEVVHSQIEKLVVRLPLADNRGRPAFPALPFEAPNEGGEL